MQGHLCFMWSAEEVEEEKEEREEGLSLQLWTLLETNDVTQPERSGRHSERAGQQQLGQWIRGAQSRDIREEGAEQTELLM